MRNEGYFLLYFYFKLITILLIEISEQEAGLPLSSHDVWKYPSYGNDVRWQDIARTWVLHFTDRLSEV